MTIEQQKILVTTWFRTLRDQICAEFEKIEQEYLHEPPVTSHESRFIRTPWTREDGGGGEMSLMKGRVFEKVGVNISTVYGEFSEPMRKEIPGGAEMPYFWASGISLVAHMCSPLVPAVHMNTRMIVVSRAPCLVHSEASASETQSTKHEACSWFGGGADLTPMYPVEQDTADFHAAFKKTCDKFDPEYYPKYKKWCDDYFFLKHRNEPRGVGGIFYDYLSPSPSPFQGESRDEGKSWGELFAFTQEVGKTFLDIYPKLVRRHMFEKWTPEEREWQLKKRGRYVEFNLLYDRGTRFGLQTSGNVEAILMSLPPEVKW